MRKTWKDSRWNGKWNDWKDIPIELRAALAWSFLNTGPKTKNEYSKIFMAMEQWRYSRHAVFLELEIEWMYNSIKTLCNTIEDIDIYRCVSIFFNKKPGNATSIRDRFTRSKINSKVLEMLDVSKKVQRDIGCSWGWMDDWYLKRKNDSNQPEFMNWLGQEQDRIARQKGVPSRFLPTTALKGPSGSKIAPLLHLGRSFPIEVSGQEIQKTIRAVEGPTGKAMVWGYVLLEPEPDIPYEPFPTHVSDWDSSFNQRWLERRILHDTDALLGGEENGLKDFPLELGLAIDQLRKPDRKDSPMSHLVLS